MQQKKQTYFYAIGLSYKKADAEVRGHFSLSESAKQTVLDQAKANGIESLVLISTCNRTELYGFAEHPYQLIHLLCENTKGTVEEFQEVAYIHKGKEAIQHMFRVGSGLDSQILGDFEIISQLKFAARASKKQGLLNSFSERLVNSVIQASKRIKTETELSSGATSVSFASVHYIMNNIQDISQKNILLFGTGKIGRNTCENLVKHTQNSHITLINRTKTKAEEVAGKFNLIVKDHEELEQEINQSDIVIVATGAHSPTVYKSLIATCKPCHCSIIAKWHDADPALQQYELSLNGGSKSLKFRIHHPGGPGTPPAGYYSIQTDPLAISTPGEWFHIAMTFTGDASAPGSFKFYVNGELKTTTTAQLEKLGLPWTQANLPDTVAPFSIGNEHTSVSSNILQGRMADFAAWTVELSAEDIYTLYNYISTEQDETIIRSGFVNLPPRIEIRNRDNATGSYPTILRMGDKDRRGSYSTQFDDTNTILFGRRIRDNFELKEEDKESGILGYTKKINTRDWTQSGDLEIRRELISSAEGSTAKDGALVLAGAGDGSGHRWIQTSEKIKNPVLEAEVIFGPYNEQRTVLKHGLGLKSPGSAEDRGLKIQVSTSGLPGTWTTIKTLTGDVESLFVLSSFSSRSAFEALLQKRKRTKIKLTPSDFSDVAGSEFYLRFAQESVSDPNQVEWAIGFVNIDYHNEDVRYPLMIDPASRVGQRIATGAIATPHELPTLAAPGRSMSGISDVHLKFTPGEGISAFDDSRINIVPENFFFQQGSDPEEVRGLSSPLWSKTQFVVDLSPNEETTFGLTNRSTYSIPSDEEDDTVKQQLMVYWNKNIKRWEKIAQGISANAPSAPSPANIESMISSGALGFSGIDYVSTGSSTSDQITNSSDVLNTYARPTSVFGFPFEGKYHATGSQFILAKEIGITKPFVLEKCQISFDAKFEFPDFNDNGVNAYALRFSSIYPDFVLESANQRVLIPTFFILRQQDYDNFSKKIKYKKDDNNAIIVSKYRNIETPGLQILGVDNEEFINVNSSREIITYGQMTMFTSSSATLATNHINIREALDRGLSRDAEVDILKLTGQTSTFTSVSESINPITSSFTINFPCRQTGKISTGTRIFLTHTGSKTGLWLSNEFGGRGYANLDSSARSLVSGTPVLNPAEPFISRGSAEADKEIEISMSSADSLDVYSPYIIMPEDKIIFGWQYPVLNNPYGDLPVSTDDRLNSMTFFGNSKLTLFGSQLKDNIEFHETNNQNLGSDATHELIGSEPAVDQFELARAIENFGNYLDNYVATSTEEPVKRVLSNVQSRLTTEKGRGGNASATISLPPNIFGFSTDSGPNNGDRIAIRDGIGQVGHFYGFRGIQEGPTRNSSYTINYQPQFRDTDGDTFTDDSLGPYFAWTGTHFEITTTKGISYALSSGTSIQYPGPGVIYANQQSPGTYPPDFIYAFRIVGGDRSGTRYTYSERT